ncbi:hypothetical protein J2W50_000699 [Herbaspirillum frisingense]|uniref:Uncharacterized protein n=1 Tax=Herbaspirillum frisingense TaxID=92645 RepID=A0ABU1P9D8_9BURK|nr:hypothetical protein [Herbaspirillum frisingense]MDR6582524.1 hypothetical protein [Herbaspirillum frisingense]
MIAGSGDDGVWRIDTFAESQGVNIAGIVVIVADGIDAIALVEDIDVVAEAAIQIIISLAARKRIVAITAIEVVITVPADEGVVASIA